MDSSESERPVGKWFALDFATYVSVTLSADDIAVAQELIVRRDCQPLIKTWLYGVQRNRRLGLAAPHPDIDPLYTALYENPQTKELIVTMTGQQPARELNGLELAAYTSAETPQVAGFMAAAWAAAFLDDDEAATFATDARLVFVPQDAETPTLQ
jgi:hypothetical protein